MAKILSQEEVDALLRMGGAGPSKIVPSPSPWPPAPEEPRSGHREPLEIKSAATVQKDQEVRNAAVLRELSRMKAMLDHVSKRGMPPSPPELPPVLLNLYGHLVENDVDPPLALRLCESTQRVPSVQEGGEDILNLDPEKVRLQLRQIIAGLIPVADPIQLEPGKTRVAVLVGPAGAGKTTALAKLATYTHQRLHLKAAFATLGASRFAVADQLQAHARVLQAPHRAALTAEDLRAALHAYRDHGLVLIDTPALNSENEEAFKRFRDVLDESPMCETHLALPATAKPRDLAAIAQRYACLKPSRFIFSKLDETATFGPILGILVREGRPLSYLSTGQAVSETLEVAASRRVADLILPAARVM